MRCLSPPSETALTGESPAPGLCVTNGAQPGSTSSAAMTAKMRSGDMFPPRARGPLWIVLRRVGARSRAAEAIVHRLPGRAAGRRLREDATRALRVQLAQPRIEIVAVAYRVGAGVDPLQRVGATRTGVQGEH